MDHVTRNATEQIISQFQSWVKSLAQKSVELRTSADAAFVSISKDFGRSRLSFSGLFGRKITVW
jgi:hypothetical protein